MRDDGVSKRVNTQTESLYHHSFSSGEPRPQVDANESPDLFERSQETSDRARQLVQKDPDNVAFSPPHYTAVSNAPKGWWKELEALDNADSTFASPIAFDGELPDGFLDALTRLGKKANSQLP